MSLNNKNVHSLSVLVRPLSISVFSDKILQNNRFSDDAGLEDIICIIVQVVFASNAVAGGNKWSHKHWKLSKIGRDRFLFTDSECIEELQNNHNYYQTGIKYKNKNKSYLAQVKLWRALRFYGPGNCFVNICDSSGVLLQNNIHLLS